MHLADSSLKKFIAASVLIHIGLLGGMTIFKTHKTKTVEVEISFGTGNSRGGSGPKAVAPKALVEAPKMLKSLNKVAAPKPTVVTDAPVVSKTTNSESTPQTAFPVSQTGESGSGLGTTSGTGSGTTSGSGAGFNDPKIKYRGQVYQLVNSKKTYPRKARALQQEGVVVAKIKLNKDGKLLKVEIVEKSSYQILTKATLDAIKGIKKFPKIPKELGLEEMTFSIPFEYKIVNGDMI